MANIPLGPYLKSQITSAVEQLVRKQNGQLPSYPDQAAVGVGDELFELMLPASNEKLIRDNSPDWMFPLQAGIYAAVLTEDSKNTYGRLGRQGASVFTGYTKEHIRIPGRGTMRHVPGITELTYDGTSLLITPNGDGSLIQQPTLRQFVQDILTISDARTKANEVATKAAKDMKAFLDQHTSLNKAAEKFGPAIWEFVPKHVKEKHDAPTVKVHRTPKTKPAPIEVDVSHIITAAVESRLNIH